MDLSRVSSGMVIDNTDNVSYLANKLTMDSFWRPGNCGIAIANECDHRLLSSGHYAHCGYVNSIPLVIDKNQTGLITASKTLLSPFGTSGVITFDLENANDLVFQLMWSVPFYATTNSITVNVAIGIERADKHLYESLVNDWHGTLVSASATPHSFQMVDGFRAFAHMRPKGPSPLALRLTLNSDAKHTVIEEVSSCY